MSCISSNFSSFFLDSLNDPSEFAKYLGNGENKMQSFDDFQMFGGNVNGNGNGYGNHQIQYNGMQYSNGVVGGIAGGVSCDQEMYSSNSSNSGDHLSQQPQPHQYAGVAAAGGATHPLHQNSNYNNQQHHHHHQQHQQQQQQQQQHQQIFTAATTHPHRWNSGQQSQVPLTGVSASNNQHHHPHHHLQHQQHLHLSQHHTTQQQTAVTGSTAVVTSTANNHHFDGSFEFLKYLRHTSEYSDDGSLGSSSSAAAPNSSSNNSHNSLIDLDSSTSMKAVRSIAGSRKSQVLSSAPTPTTGLINRSSIVDIDSFDHDSKHTIFDLQHQSTNSNSNESSSCAGDAMSGAFASAHLNASNSNTSSEGGVCGVGLVSGGVGGVITGAGSDNSSSNQNSNASKPLVNFSIKENFDVHPAHKVEEGIFQHMNKLPPKKKETLKQLGVRFTGQMTLADKSIVVENFIKFCQEYEVTDHRPFLSLNQSGLNKPEQIKFARYLGQGLPAFTLFCIYSNFKNLFCTKRTETYIKDGYNLHYILDKTKRHLSCTTADLKNLTQQSPQSNDGIDFPTNNNNGCAAGGGHGGNTPIALIKSEIPKVLEHLVIYENFDVHETHRIEDGVCTHISRLPPKKQELLKQFGIQSNQTVTYYEKYIIIENFIKFCNEYKVTDHRPFLDFHDSGLPKCEQLKFVRYLGQGLPNLTLNKIYLAFRDVLGLNRIEKITVDGYNLDIILKKKKKNLYNRMHAAVHRESTEAAKQAHRESLAS